MKAKLDIKHENHNKDIEMRMSKLFYFIFVIVVVDDGGDAIINVAFRFIFHFITLDILFTLNCLLFAVLFYLFLLDFRSYIPLSRVYFHFTVVILLLMNNVLCFDNKLCKYFEKTSHRIVFICRCFQLFNASVIKLATQ